MGDAEDALKRFNPGDVTLEIKLKDRKIEEGDRIRLINEVQNVATNSQTVADISKGIGKILLKAFGPGL